MLRIKNLTKHFGAFMALDGLNMHVTRGSIYGLVGPNGAGKTTTMRIVSGLMKADSGAVYMDDIYMQRRNSTMGQMIGYVPDFFGVYDQLKVSEYMAFFASMYNIPKEEGKKRSDELLVLLRLKDKEESYVDTLSRGMKQRLCLARALIHRPEILILDEPSSGLDPRARYEMKEMLKKLCEQGITILISSHILSELSEMCTHIGIINHGRMIYEGTVDEISDMMLTAKPIHMTVLGKRQEALEILRESPFVEKLSFSKGDIVVDFKGNDVETMQLLTSLVEHHIPVSAFGREPGGLEALFLEITGTGDDTNADKSNI